MGGLLIAAFQLCFLLHSSKTAVVSNTAAATLQQLVLSSFEKVTKEYGQLHMLYEVHGNSNYSNFSRSGLQRRGYC